MRRPNAVHQLAALTIGARIAVADAWGAAHAPAASALSATSGMIRPWVDRRTAPSFGQYLGALAAQFFHACPDHSKIIGGAGSGVLAAQLLHA
jgi:hypothetical protein